MGESINIVTKNAGALLVANTQTGLAENVEKAMYVSTSCQHNVGKYFNKKIKSKRDKSQILGNGINKSKFPTRRN